MSKLDDLLLLENDMSIPDNVMDVYYDHVLVPGPDIPLEVSYQTTTYLREVLGA